MRIIFSRKGFDTSFGGGPSPIIEGRPLSLPIPGSRGERTTYAKLGIAKHVRAATRGKLTGRSACHDDPMFANGLCWLGQHGAAQGHLRKQGVSDGDVFLFFGLFADPHTAERHHRLFGWMQVACHGAPELVPSHPRWTPPPRPHPHFTGDWGAGNTIWHGPGASTKNASNRLRLTRKGGPLTLWAMPEWLGSFGLSYHANPQRWPGGGLLDSAKRGQEFVCHIGDADEPRHWLSGIIAEMKGE